MGLTKIGLKNKVFFGFVSMHVDKPGLRPRRGCGGRARLRPSRYYFFGFQRSPGGSPSTGSLSHSLGAWERGRLGRPAAVLCSLTCPTRFGRLRPSTNHNGPKDATDDFARSDISPWINVLGTWTTANGVLQGSSLPSTYAVVYYAPTPRLD
jgi:hypothetical protein